MTTESEIDKILLDYATIDTNELGEDKFKGHYNLPQAKAALEALIKYERYTSAIDEATAVCKRMNDEILGEVSRTKMIRIMDERIAVHKDRLAQLSKPKEEE